MSLKRIFSVYRTEGTWLCLLTAISVAAENESGLVVDTRREGPTAIAMAMRLTLFISHQFLFKATFEGSCHSQHMVVALVLPLAVQYVNLQ